MSRNRDFDTGIGMLSYYFTGMCYRVHDDGLPDPVGFSDVFNNTHY